MKRNISQLAEQSFDVLIVGSGIYGAFLAREASMRGLRVALIDQGDFGSAASANSLKVVHGGLRYLQHLNLTRMRESIRARRQLLKMAPYLVRPQTFVIPTYGWGLQSKWIMRAALLVNDILSFDRNTGLPDSQRIPNGRVLSRRQSLQYLSCIEEQDLTGAAMWSDGFIDDTERLMIAIIHSSVEQGASVANYVSAESFIRQGNRISGVSARDKLSGDSFSIKANFVIDATGNDVTGLRASLNLKNEVPPSAWVKAFNVFIKKPIVEKAGIGLSSMTQYTDQGSVVNRGKRLYFFIPWKGGTLVGTDYAKAESDNGTAKISDEELDCIIGEINDLLPCAELNRKDIGYCQTGFLPANKEGSTADAASRLLKNTSIIDHHENSGIDGLLTVTGIKYTVAPQVVIKIIDDVVNRLNRSIDRPATEPHLYGAEENTIAPEEADNPRLFHRYGCRAVEVIEIAKSKAGRNDPISDDTETIVAEVIYAIRMEMAVSLVDVVFRRTGMANTGTPDQRTIKICADLMAIELSWSADQVLHEIDEVNRYRSLRKG